MTQKNNKTVCRKWREKIGFSIRETAELLDTKPATFQRYDDGTAQTPRVVIDAIKTYHQREQQRMKERYRPGGVLDKELAHLRVYGRPPVEVLTEAQELEYETGIVRIINK